MSWLRQPLGPLPRWAWALLVGGGAAALIALTRRGQPVPAVMGGAPPVGAVVSSMGTLPSVDSIGAPVPAAVPDAPPPVAPAPSPMPVAGVQPPAPAVPPPAQSPPQPPAPEVSPSSQRIVTVCRWPAWCGSLWGIAQHYYGDGSQWRRIYDANRGVIGANPSLIRPGQALVVP